LRRDGARPRDNIPRRKSYAHSKYVTCFSFYSYSPQFPKTQRADSLKEEDGDGAGIVAVEAEGPSFASTRRSIGRCGSGSRTAFDRGRIVGCTSDIW
jgi:hypothetical protein